MGFVATDRIAGSIDQLQEFGALAPAVAALRRAGRAGDVVPPPAFDLRAAAQCIGVGGDRRGKTH